MATRTIERNCNLTLTRAEWSVLVGMLDRQRIYHPSSGGIPGAAIAVIDKALRDDPDSARVSIDRPCEKWSTVLNLVWNDGVKRGGETNRVCGSMTEQISASEFTGDD